MGPLWGLRVGRDAQTLKLVPAIIQKPFDALNIANDS